MNCIQKNIEESNQQNLGIKKRYYLLMYKLDSFILLDIVNENNKIKLKYLLFS